MSRDCFSWACIFNKAVPCAFAMSTTASFFHNKTKRKEGKGKYEQNPRAQSINYLAFDFVLSLTDWPSLVSFGGKKKWVCKFIDTAPGLGIIRTFKGFTAQELLFGLWSYASCCSTSYVISFSFVRSADLGHWRWWRHIWFTWGKGYRCCRRGAFVRRLLHRRLRRIWFVTRVSRHECEMWPL